MSFSHLEEIPEPQVSAEEMGELSTEFNSSSSIFTTSAVSSSALEQKKREDAEVNQVLEEISQVEGFF